MSIICFNNPLNWEKINKRESSSKLIKLLPVHPPPSILMKVIYPTSEKHGIKLNRPFLFVGSPARGGGVSLLTAL